MYSAWDTFDVEKELALVDQQEQSEARQKQQCKLLQAKESVETLATRKAQQSADILAAQAAVAALKAKKRHHTYPNAKSDALADAIKVEKLKTQAQLFAQKHQLLQEILENRRQGDSALAEEKKEANVFFKNALAAIQKLEKLVPELLQDEKKHESFELLDKNAPECKEKPSYGDKSCHREKEPKAKRTEALPKANDLVAIITMFYTDVYMGIGTCDLKQGRLAAATEAYKEVLVRDDEHVMAWLQRGQAFEEMNALLVAMLHYNRIMSLDSEHEKGKEFLERVKSRLLTEGDARNDSDAIKNIVFAYTGALATQDHVRERIQWTFEEANVLAIEKFHDYSMTKYQIVLGCLNQLQSQENCVILKRVLKEIAISCHLNIASACLEMQRNYLKGIRHCKQALDLDAHDAMIIVHMGQLYHALHKYDNALECFKQAKTLVRAAMADERRTEMLVRIEKETDKCEYTRSQYNLEYLLKVQTTSNGL